MEYDELTAEAFDRLGLADWRFELNSIRATFRLSGFPAATALATSIIDAAERLVHHPDLDLRYPGRLRVVLTTHAVGQVTTLDAELAAEISRLADAAGAVSEPQSAVAVEFAIDTHDADRIRPFWRAVLGYDEHHGALVDPLRIGPPMWFQAMDVPRTGRGRFHIDVTVPHDVAEQRVAAAIAAGGRLVTDRYARSWWVLADADGNEACVCTWQDRD